MMGQTYYTLMSMEKRRRVMSAADFKKMGRALGKAARVVEQTDPTLADKLREFRKPGRTGGKLPGSGRKVVFRGKRKKLSVKVTELAIDLVKLERAQLEPEWGTAATDAAAVESLLRKGAALSPAGRRLLKSAEA